MASLMKGALPSPAVIASGSVADLRGIIVDCDGVLFDSKEANTAYYNHIRLAVNLPPITEEQAAYSHMVSADEAIEHIIPPGLLAEAVTVRETIRYRDMFMSMMQPAPYVYPFLRAMRERGMPLALCTNRTDSVYHVLEHFGMESFFAPVMSISHVRPKPDPQGLLEIIRIWDRAPDSLIFLGDSLVDQQAAAGAGIPFWSFKNPELASPMHIAGFKELEDIVRMMLMR